MKEKTLAAYRAGLREVILPKGNEKDLRDVPPEVRANHAGVPQMTGRRSKPWREVDTRNSSVAAQSKTPGAGSDWDQ